MAADDPLHEREADPGTREFSRCVQALENPEELVAVLWLESDSVVGDFVPDETAWDETVSADRIEAAR